MEDFGEKQEDYSSKKSSSYIDRTIEEISKPSSWLKAVQGEQNVSPTILWHVNKEKIYEKYHNRLNVWIDTEGFEETHPIDWEPKCNHIKLSHQVVILPNGKMIAPIRQYCETKILPRGTKEAFFYDFSTTYESTIEGIEYTPQPVIRTSKAETDPRGTRINIGYQETENTPIDIIASTNRAFSLESINDENKQTFVAFNTLKNPSWVDNNGDVIIDDYHITKDDKLTPEAILGALDIIINEGLDTTNVILYTTGKAIIDLIDSEWSRLRGINNIVGLGRSLGIRIIRDGSLTNTATATINKPENIFSKIKRVLQRRPREKIIIGGEGKRSVLFIPNIAFGIVSGRDLTMEAQRRNELQAISVTGTQRIASLVKNKEAIVRISHG